MALHTIKRGLDLPIEGAPEQIIHDGNAVTRVAVIADDYIGMRPTMHVQVGDTVKRGQLLFEDKKTEGVSFTAPGAGTVVAVNRGERRALQSVVVELNANEVAGTPSDDDLVSFESFTSKVPEQLSDSEITALLQESGLWTAFRTRPFSKVPKPGTQPDAIFVTAIDTNPLAPSMDVIIEGQEEDFEFGLLCISKLTVGTTFLCTGAKTKVPNFPNAGLQHESFSGLHPAGTVGLHVHLCRPVSRLKNIWHIGMQDVIAIGKLFKTGKLDVDRVVSLGGPPVSNPRLLRTRLGASTEELAAGEVAEGENRLISGSVLSGRTATGEVHGFLGRYHQSVSVLKEGNDREFIGWMLPGQDKFSVVNVYASALMPGKKFGFTTNTNGSKRAMVPIGTYEKVLPFDIEPTHLLRALVVGDLDRAEKLGCLELDEEDLALCTFACPAKYDYGPALRRNLLELEKEF
jgi:Na+-transporting NADH:ubiquinone oxidoreductase subunit A